MSNTGSVIDVYPSYGYGYVVPAEGFSERIVGKVLTLIETLGLTSKQEEAIKGLAQQAIYGSFQEAIYITPDRHNEIRNVYYKKLKEIGQEVPMSAI